MKIIWITEARYVGEYVIAFRFSDGVQKSIDLKKHLTGEVFEPLLDLVKFRDFKVTEWTIEWSNGADLSPEFLYAL